MRWLLPPHSHPSVESRREGRGATPPALRRVEGEVRRGKERWERERIGGRAILIIRSVK
jgi:hypothetical protein